MKTSYTVAVSMFVGAAIGAVAIQGLHAQAKSKAYLISESEVLDKTLVEAWNSQVQKTTKDAGGSMVFSDKVIAVIGAAPQRAVITEFESVAKADAYLNSSERKALFPQRDKAVKIVRQYIIEGK